ncbi:MAG: zinc-binding dehydrogenase [Planctomycetota bacterium]|nr:zinc-binding dehydrogenase [Planctomycetota bacterium]
MKAAVIRRFGDPDSLAIEEIDTPRPKPRSVVIKVLAAGVNRFDHYIREGSVTPELTWPHILGADAAGEIAAVGEGVIGFEIGERVVPLTGYPFDEKDADTHPGSAAPSYGVLGLHTPGTYAQYVEIPARWVVKDETGLSPEEVATLPMAVATSVRAVKSVGEVGKGDKVLIVGGSSSVGTIEIQVAKALGADVAATVRSPAKGEMIRALGADLVINTREEDLVERVKKWTDGRGVDVVIDNLGGEFVAKGMDALRTQGILVAVGFVAGLEVTFDIRNFFFGQKQMRGALAADIDELRFGLDLVRDGKIKPTLDRALPLSEAAEAHRLVSTNQVTGSLVLLPGA